MDAYKKKYKEALERARIWQNHLYETNDKGDRDYADELNYIFPELRESINERVKKVIKQVLNESTTEKDECYSNNRVTQQEVFAWVEKQGEKKPAWSEEDEKMYKEVLTDIIYAKNDLEAKECLGLSKRAMKAFDWFSKRYKSLRPQTTWKPSWERLNALEDSIEFLGCTKKVREGLKSLYEQLKKL